jgi:hypothetical protein
MLTVLLGVIAGGLSLAASNGWIAASPADPQESVLRTGH